VGGCPEEEALEIFAAAATLQRFVLDGTKLSPKSVHSLCSHGHFAGLRALHLSSAGLGGATGSSESVRLLCEALSQTTALRELGLAANGLSDQDALALARASDGNGLRADLRHNAIWEPEHEELPKSWQLYPPGYIAGSAVGVDKRLEPLLAPNETTPISQETWNIVTVSEGMLIVEVAFDDQGDDDQHFGVMEEAVRKGTSYYHLREQGWILKDSNRPRAKGRWVQGDMWLLRGETIVMALDMDARTVTFWGRGENAGKTVTIPDLPKGRSLTAALSLYDNRATLTGLRHVLPPKAEGSPDAAPAAATPEGKPA